MKYVDLGHVRLRYAQRPAKGVVPGSREHILLLHGLASNVGLWFFRIAPMLARRYHVTMLDLPGHGRSSLSSQGYTPNDIANDVFHCMKHLNIDRAHLVGHSFGGAVTMKFAHLFGERVQSITLIDSRLRQLQEQMPISSWQHWTRYRELIERYGVSIDEQTQDFGFDVLVAMAKLRITSPKNSQLLSEQLPVSLLSSGGVPAARRWLDLVEQDGVRDDLTSGENITREELTQIRKPFAGVYGALSPNMGTAEQLQLIWPHAQIKVVPNVGHFFTESHPNDIIAAITKVVKSATLPDSSVG